MNCPYDRQWTHDNTMYRTMNPISIFLIFILSLSGCGEYQNPPKEQSVSVNMKMFAPVSGMTATLVISDASSKEVSRFPMTVLSDGSVSATITLKIGRGGYTVKIIYHVGDLTLMEATAPLQITSAQTASVSRDAFTINTNFDDDNDRVTNLAEIRAQTDPRDIGSRPLISIAVTPDNPSVLVGLTQQFTATGTFSDGTISNLTSTATWSSSVQATATINASGLATGIAIGTTTITATSGSIGGSTTLTVGAAILQSIAITPANPSVAVGLTQQFMATGTFSDGTTSNLTAAVTWSSSVQATATINASGLATGI